jgi:peroxiredoxin
LSTWSAGFWISLAVAHVDRRRAAVTVVVDFAMPVGNRQRSPAYNEGRKDRAMRISIILAVTLSLVACSQKSEPAAKAKTAQDQMAKAEPPRMTLGVTADDKLGLAPAGFGLAVGTAAPDGSLPDVTGATQQLAAIYTKGPTFVVFYRGGWCPFCNVQLHELTVAKPEFDRRGVQLVAISVDQPSQEAATQAKHGVPFAMLSDSKLTVHQAFKVVHVPSPEEAKALAGYGIDLAGYSGEQHGNFAVPAVFLIDRGGMIRFAHVDEDYKVRPSVAQLLAVADKVLASK